MVFWYAYHRLWGTPRTISRSNVLGTQEGIRISRKGYPSRVLFAEFFQRYNFLAPSTKGSLHNLVVAVLFLAYMHFAPRLQGHPGETANRSKRVADWADESVHEGWRARKDRTNARAQTRKDDHLCASPYAKFHIIAFTVYVCMCVLTYSCVQIFVDTCNANATN